MIPDFPIEQVVAVEYYFNEVKIDFSKVNYLASSIEDCYGIYIIQLPLKRLLLILNAPVEEG